MSTAPGGIGPIDLGRSVPLRIVDDTDRADAAPGDAMVLTSQGSDRPCGYAFRCPGCGVETALPLLSSPSQPRPFWTVSAGDPRRAEGLTLSPSIHHAAPRGCGWHGWLRNGVLSPC